MFSKCRSLAICAFFFSQSTAHPLAPNPTASLVEGPPVVGRRFPVSRLGVVGRIRLAAMPRVGFRNLVPHTNRHELESRVPVPILLKARPRRAPGPRRLCRLDSRDRHAPPDAPAPLCARFVAELFPGVCAVVVRDFVAAPARPSPSHQRAGARARAARAAASRVLPHHSEHVLKQPRALPSIPLTKKPYPTADASSHTTSS